MMIRASTLIPAFLLSAGLAMSGYAMAQPSNDDVATPLHATIALAANDCVGNSQPDPQDCYPPNRQGKREFIRHSA
ncbi:hypothetical protein FRZ44_39920 [Hypericibacter terrae]|jgi:hypothetical protein|uniref:Uncharacterized protein n=2 Tax=Hypericibacter terrae TaxID=2602015 RepID=A0A5J6MM40_9PROT|nr:hypothetical protein FRZ44_39920 [Hypericibacter terrae]